METAHDVVVDAAGTVVGRVLDLGCGDGALLGRWSKCERVGIEIDAGRVERGRARRPQLDLRIGRIEDTGLWPEEYDVAFLMPGRLIEMSSEDADRVRAQLRSRTRRVIAYAYGDWLSRFGDLSHLASMCGMSLAGESRRGSGTEAAEVI
jgi:SAM-dependent methyltransferase